MSVTGEISLTEQLAEWLVGQRQQGMPENVLKAAQNYVLDWLGSALAGHSTVPGGKLLDYAQAQPDGVARIIGRRMKRAAAVAALVNGGLSHIVEMDDLDRGSVVHPGTVVIPAALAVADNVGADGQAFLSAVVAGYDVAIRIGEAVGKRHYYYFHNTSTCGVFGAAAAAGWLLGLDAEAFVWALGNAGTRSSGLWQFNTEGSMSKHLHAGRAAADGVLAAELAARGFTGARRILEGRRGFFAAMAPDARPERVVEGLVPQPQRYKIENVSIKPHASCRHVHPATDAALALHNRLQGHVPSRVQVHTYQAALDLCDNSDPQTPYAAKFSLQYCVAASLCGRATGPASFTPETVHDAAVRRLMPHVEVAVDPEFEARYPASWPARVRVVLPDGSDLSETVAAPKGDPENPLTTTELEAKFRELAAYGGHAAEADSWLDWTNALRADREAEAQAIAGR